MAITNKDDPVLVNRPSSDIARGHMEGHIRELANPSSAIKSTDVNPLVSWEKIMKMIPNSAENVSDCCWEKYLGIPMIPMRYPVSIKKRVIEVNNLALLKAIPW